MIPWEEGQHFQHPDSAPGFVSTICVFLSSSFSIPPVTRPSDNRHRHPRASPESEPQL